MPAVLLQKLPERWPCIIAGQWTVTVRMVRHFAVFRYNQRMRVRELAEWLGATFEGDGERDLVGAAPLETAGGSDIGFVGTRRAAEQAAQSAAGCLLVPHDWPNPNYRTVIRVPE